MSQKLIKNTAKLDYPCARAPLPLPSDLVFQGASGNIRGGYFLFCLLVRLRNYWL